MKLNYKLMKDICLAPIERFHKLGNVTQCQDGQMYIYKENPKAKILAIAHLDSVLDLHHFYRIDEKHETTIINAQLDDRLGVYTMLDILPQLGIEFNLLLTEGEEIGRSTAYYFESQKEYNWMFSFDRRLNDVVLYQYANKELESDLTKAGFRIGNGSFSDISFADHLGIRGFNIGVGYNGEHSAICHAYMSMLVSQVKKFAKFYAQNVDKRYPYEIPIKQASKASYTFPAYIDDECYLCGDVSPKGDEYNGVWICDNCIVSALECASCGDIVKDTELKDGVCQFCRYESAR
jgi:hypothetical protein